jgi:hypothetical protein
LVALGSIKVNPVAEFVLTSAFGGVPFESEDDVETPTKRHCPVMVRFRDTDPQPPSFCAGRRLSLRESTVTPGIYYEKQDGTWACCPWVAEESDAAMVFYVYRPHMGRAEVTCGGFSSRATNCLRADLDSIVRDMGPPQVDTDEVCAGMYVVQFAFDPADEDYDEYRDNRPWKTNVIRLDDAVLRRRLRTSPRGGPGSARSNRRAVGSRRQG